MMMPLPHKALSKKIHKEGFNLIEAAIVLGVVGLVIGGIWIAAASVQRLHKINDLAKGIVLSFDNARKLLPLYSYPTTFSQETYIGSTLYNAGTYPSGWKQYGNSVISPQGVYLEILQACWSNCPLLGAKIYRHNMSSSDCVETILKFAATYKNTTELKYIQINSTTSPIVYVVPPITTSAVQCPNDWTQLTFWLIP